MMGMMGCGGAMLLSLLLWVGVIGGVVCLVIRLGGEDRPVVRADDAWELARTRYARGEITAEELDALGLRLRP
jgi:putative membrane protein